MFIFFLGSYLPFYIDLADDAFVVEALYIFDTKLEKYGKEFMIVDIPPIRFEFIQYLSTIMFLL